MFKKLIIITLLSLLAICFAADSDVIVLDDNTIDAEIAKHPAILVEFYAPWCGHCKAFAPEYEKIATKLKGKVPVAKIDCDANRKSAEKYDIQGFPTVKLFKNGKFYKEYEQERTVDAVVRWVLRHTGPPAKELKTQQEIDEFVKEQNGQAVIGFFKSKDSDEYKTFIKEVESAKVFEDFPAGEVFDEELTKSVDGPAIKLYRTFDTPLVSKDFTKLKEFVTENGYPLIEEISAKNFQRFIEANIPLSVLFLDYSNEKQKQETIKLIEGVAAKTKGKMNWVYSDGKEYRDQLEVMGGDPSKLPAIAAMNIEKRQNFPYTGEMKEEDIIRWVEDVAAGKVAPFMRSEPIPEKNDGPVKIVVGKTYEEIALDKTKDVLLEFYAPWCGHCKALQPKYEALGEYFKEIQDKLVIAKIDATNNDTPYPIEGFPTIVFFPATDKEHPIQYEGDRSVKDMIQFIKKHATVSKDAVNAIKKPIPKPGKKDKKKKKLVKDEL